MENLKCLECVHIYIPFIFDGPVKCPAFPNGVPEDILNGAPHDKVREGQNGDFVFNDNHDMFGHLYISPENLPKPLCDHCKHYQGNGKCPAFDKIPFINVEAAGHDKPYFGQNKSNVAFEEK